MELKWNQDRAPVLFGKSRAYRLQNRGLSGLRRAQYAALMSIKEGECGGFAEHVASGYAAGGAWRRFNTSPEYRAFLSALRADHSGMQGEIARMWDDFAPNVTSADDPADLFQHCANGVAWMKAPSACQIVRASRSVCSAPHRSRPGVTVAIERVGPFRSRGDYSWTSAMSQNLHDVAALRSVFAGRNVSVVGGMIAPVHANGTAIGYPPLHIHHAHLIPFGSWAERVQRLRHTDNDHHDIMVQAHGDSECVSEEGGIACNLVELPEGRAFSVSDARSGLVVDWDINDQRAAGSEPLTWYVDHVVMYRVEDAALAAPATPAAALAAAAREGRGPPPREAATYFGLNNPCWGEGPCTYDVPLDPSSTINWYSYTHNTSRLGPGWLTGPFVVHMHQSIADSGFVFVGRGLSAALDAEVRRGRNLPLVLECAGGGARGALGGSARAGPSSLAEAKQTLARLVEGLPRVRLLCETTRPGLVFDAARGIAMDKSNELNCLDRVRLDEGEEITVVAFTAVRPHNLTRGSEAHEKMSVFARGRFVAFQHAIFRGVFLTDAAWPYKPPAFWYYATRDYQDLFQPAKWDEAELNSCPAPVRVSLSFDPRADLQQQMASAQARINANRYYTELLKRGPDPALAPGDALAILAAAADVALDGQPVPVPDYDMDHDGFLTPTEFTLVLEGIWYSLQFGHTEHLEVANLKPWSQLVLPFLARLVAEQQPPPPQQQQQQAAAPPDARDIGLARVAVDRLQGWFATAVAQARRDAVQPGNVTHLQARTPRH
jgi:hypothetical protein